MRKKFLSLFIAVSMVFSIIVMPVSALNGVTFGSVKAKATPSGATTTISLEVELPANTDLTTSSPMVDIFLVDKTAADTIVTDNKGDETNGLADWLTFVDEVYTAAGPDVENGNGGIWVDDMMVTSYSLTSDDFSNQKAVIPVGSVNIPNASMDNYYYLVVARVDVTAPKPSGAFSIDQTGKVPVVLNPVKVTVAATDAEYTGSAYVGASLTDGSGSATLYYAGTDAAGVEYAESTTAPTNAGTYTVTAKLNDDTSDEFTNDSVITKGFEITKKEITVTDWGTVSTTDKDFDGTTTTAATVTSPTFTGMVGGDTGVAKIDLAWSAAIAGTNSMVGTLALDTTNAAKAANYKVADPATTNTYSSIGGAQIQPKEVALIYPTNVTKEYDTTTDVPAGTKVELDTSSLESGYDTVSLTGAQTMAYASADISESAMINVTSVGSLAGAHAGNYKLPTLGSFTGKITKVGVQLTGLPTTLTGAIAGEAFDFASEVTGIKVEKTTGGTDVTTDYNITFSGTDVSGTTLTSATEGTKTVTVTATHKTDTAHNDGATATFNITVGAAKTALTPAVAAGNVTYNGSAQGASVTFEASGVPVALTAGVDYDLEYSVSGANSFSATAPTNAGTYDVRVTLTGAADTYKLVGGTSTATYTIGQKEVTLAYGGDITKTYDGDTTATVNSAQITVTNAGSDTVNVSGSATGVYNAATVAGANAVTVTGLSLDNANYKLPTTVSFTASITPATITVSNWGTVTVTSKAFDGDTTTDATINSATFDNVVAADNGVAKITTAWKAADAGTNTIVGTLEIDATNPKAGNYQITAATHDYTGHGAEIEKKTLGLTYPAGVTKEWDNTNAVPASAKVTIDNTSLVTDHTDVSLTGAQTMTYDSTELGATVAITVTDVGTLTGGDAANYKLPASLGSFNGAITIVETELQNVPATIIGAVVGEAFDFSDKVTGIKVVKKNGGGDLTGNYTLTYTGTGVNGTELTAQSAGNVTVTVAGQHSDTTHYQNVTGTFDITATAKTDLTPNITANNVTYNGSEQGATVTFTAGGTAVPLTAGSDYDLEYSVQSANTFSTTVPTAAGDYDVRVVLKGTAAATYTLVGTSTDSYTIEQKEAALAYGEAITKTYDGKTDATVNTAQITVTNADSDTVNVSGSANAVYNNANVATASSVTVTGLSLDNANYKLPATVTFEAAITKATITVNSWGSVTASNKAFDGNTTTDAAANSVTYNNVVAADGVVAKITTAWKAAAAGTDTIVGTLVLDTTNAMSANYEIADPAPTNDYTGHGASIQQKEVSLTYPAGVTKEWDGNNTLTLASGQTIEINDASLVDGYKTVTLNTATASMTYGSTEVAETIPVTVTSVGVLEGTDAANYKLPADLGTFNAAITKVGVELADVPAELEGATANEEFNFADLVKDIKVQKTTGATDLTANYTLAYSGTGVNGTSLTATNDGRVTVTVTATHTSDSAHFATVTDTFDIIVGAARTELTANITAGDVTYSGAAQGATAAFTKTAGGDTVALVAGTDYDLEYSVQGASDFKTEVPKDAGTYEVKAVLKGDASLQYKLSSVTTKTYTINPLEATFAYDGTITKAYDSTTDATVDVANISVSNKVATDTVNVSGTLAAVYNDASVANANSVVVTGLVLDNANYKLPANVNLAASITKRDVSIGFTAAATKATKVYGDTMTLDASDFEVKGATDFVGGDTLAGMFTNLQVTSAALAANAEVNNGTPYAVTITTQPANYNVTVDPATTITVTKRDTVLAFTPAAGLLYKNAAFTKMNDNTASADREIGTIKVTVKDGPNANTDLMASGAEVTLSLASLQLNGADTALIQNAGAYTFNLGGQLTGDLAANYNSPEGLTSQTLSVGQAAISKLVLTTPPSKMSYITDVEKFDKTGAKLEAVYNEGSAYEFKADVTASTIITAPASAAADEVLTGADNGQKVTFSYTEAGNTNIAAGAEQTAQTNELTVADQPVVATVTSPVDATATMDTEGKSSASFTAGSTVTDPATGATVTYEWFLQAGETQEPATDTKITTGGIYSVSADGTTLTVTDAAAADSGNKYYAKVVVKAAGYNDYTGYTTSAVLTVQKGTQGVPAAEVVQPAEAGGKAGINITGTAGAVVGIYSDADCTQLVGETVTLDQDGKGSALVDAGTYYARYEETAYLAAGAVTEALVAKASYSITYNTGAHIPADVVDGTSPVKADGTVQTYVLAGETVDLTGVAYAVKEASKAQYAQIGWYDAAGNQVTAPVAATDDLVFTAQWSFNVPVSATAVAGGKTLEGVVVAIKDGTTDVNSVTYTDAAAADPSAKALSVTAPEVAGYTFKGWTEAASKGSFTPADQASATYQAPAMAQPAGSFALVATYELNKYDINSTAPNSYGTYTYSVAGGEAVEGGTNTADIAFGTKVAIVPKADSGRVLDSVKVTKADDSAVNVNVEVEDGVYTFTMPNYAVTITVNFRSGSSGGGGVVPATSYKVTYDAGSHGEIADGSATETVKRSAKPENVPEIEANDGYKFLGWSTDGKTVVDPTEVTITKNTTFKALYEDLNASPKPSASAKPTTKPTATPTTTPEPGTDRHDSYINGYEDGTFRPDFSITRAEVAAIFGRALTKYDEGQTYDNKFPDVNADAWYANYVNYMAGIGAITGYEDGSFRPEQNISRQEFTAMISRLGTVLDAGDMNFSDVANDSWAIDFIYTAYKNGWVSGYEDGTFRPANNITRAEAVKIVNAYLKRGTDANGLADAKYKKFSDVQSSHWAYFEIIEASNNHDFEEGTTPEKWVK